MCWALLVSAGVCFLGAVQERRDRLRTASFVLFGVLLLIVGLAGLAVRARSAG